MEAYTALVAHYNAAIWPAQLVTGALVLGCLVLAFIATSSKGRRTIGVSLALLWAFVAIAFYHLHLHRLSFMAPIYTAAFLIEAVLIAIVFTPARIRVARPRVMAGLGITLIGVLIYPGAVLALEGNWQALRAPGATPGGLLPVTIGLVMMAGLSARRDALLLAIPLVYSAAAAFKCWYIWGRLLV
jgi:hypothetical protein